MLVRTMLLVSLMGVLCSDAVRAETLVEWLDARQHPSSPEKRTEYWAKFSPDVAYTKSAAQNTALLNALKVDAATPNLALLTPVVEVGDQVEAKLQRGESGSSKMGIESNLRGQSFEANDGATVSLGRAAKEGAYSIRVIDKLHVREMLVVLTLNLDGKLSVLLTGDARKFKTESGAATPVTRPSGYGEAVRKLKETLDTNRWKQAFADGTVPFIAENVSAIGGSFVICSLAVATEGALAKECAVSLTQNGMSYGATVFATYVDLTRSDTSIPDSNRLTDAEANILKTAVNSLKLVADIGFSIRGTDKTKLCKALGLLGSVASFAATEIDNSSGRMVATIFVDQSNKIVEIFCGAPLLN